MNKSRIALASLLGALLIFGPSLARAGEHDHQAQRDDITITKDSQLDRAHGVRSGRGTPDNPFVISGWTVGNLSVSDTSKAIKIVGNTIGGQLRLNWVGRAIEVHDNEIGDLRVNENVARTGAPTSGMIAHNHFGVVGQLRHFDGMFVYNVVGYPQGLTLFGTGQAVNFDGFNGAHLSHNLIYGTVDARLHGHHHSSSYGTASHMHTGGMDMMMDHTQRYHEVWIEYNHIIAPGASYGLSYLDTGHDQNDRTANSETNPKLVGPHVHYTRVHIIGNQIDGAGIMVQEFNATDQYHRTFAPGSLDIIGNHITLEEGRFYPFGLLTGIQVWAVRSLSLRIDRNTIIGPDHLVEQPVSWIQTSEMGIWLDNVNRARVLIGSNRVTKLEYGIYAQQMTRSVNWMIGNLITEDVAQPVYYDQGSVANRPRRA